MFKRTVDDIFLPPGPADRPTASDRLLNRTILPLLPPRIYPNHLTVLRFLLTPIILVFLFLHIWRWAIVLFFLAALSDALDGALARTRRQITAWGKVYDPLADKILIGSTALFVLPMFFDWGLVFAIVAVELLLLGGAYFFKDRLGRPIQANRWGKVKMVCQSLGMLLVLFAAAAGFPTLLPLALAAFYTAIVLAVVSLFTYGI